MLEKFNKWLGFFRGSIFEEEFSTVNSDILIWILKEESK